MYISNKDCRVYYRRASCTCPDGRCWVLDQRVRQERGDPHERPDEWRKRIENDQAEQPL